MPSLYHSKVVNIDADHTALLIFLDTNAISSFQSYTGSDAAQREWLIKLLENSDDDAVRVRVCFLVWPTRARMLLRTANCDF